MPVISSVNTKYAHKLKEFYDIQNQLSGLADDADKDLPLLKESQKILNLAGHWNSFGEFRPNFEAQGILKDGSTKMVHVAAEHQRQAKDTYDEVNKLIFAATRIKKGIANAKDCATYCSASISMNQRSSQASRGQSQSSGYSAQTSAYGVRVHNDNSNDSQVSEDEKTEEEDSNIPTAVIVEDTSA